MSGVKSMIFDICLMTTITMSIGATKPTVLAILMDGLRWDYVDKTPRTPNFDFMAKTGVKAESLIPVYPTSTYPNVFTALTGLYPESHGIVDNVVYDTHTGLSMKHEWSVALQWLQAEPLQVTLERGNKRLLRLPQNVRNISPPWELVHNAVNALVNDEADFIMLYLLIPDYLTHTTGAFGWITKLLIRYLDNILGQIFESLRANAILDSVDVVVFGDHGMTHSPKANAIDVDKCLGRLLDEVVIRGPNVHVEANILDDVYAALANCHPRLKVYRKHELAGRLHYSNNDRIGQLIMMFDDAWYRYVDPLDSLNIARHGYDPRYPDMHAAFYARGPHFRANFTSSAFSILHLYPLACHVMGVEPLPHNGSLGAIEHVLVK